MRQTDTTGKTVGRVRLFDSDGELLLERSNIITLDAATLMARLVAGDRGSAPAHIGFIYGTDASPAGGMDTPTDRDQSWQGITDDVLAASGNMIICPLVLPAAVSDEGGSSTYEDNKVTFTSHTGAFSTHAFTPGENGFADAIGDVVGDVYIYHAVLLNVDDTGASPAYTPFARVNLGTAPYTAKADGREQSLYWDIIFR